MLHETYIIKNKNLRSYIRVRRSDEFLALVRVSVGLYDEALSCERHGARPVGPREEAGRVEGHLQLGGGAHEQRTHGLGLGQPVEANLHDLALRVWSVGLDYCILATVKKTIILI